MNKIDDEEKSLTAYQFDDISSEEKIQKAQKELLQLENQVYRKDLYAFNTEVLEVDINNKNVHKPWCKMVCKCKTWPYQLLLAPRGHLKSTNITIGYSLFRLVHNRNIRILIVNATASNAQSFLRAIKDHLTDNDKFKQIFGDYTTNSDKWSEKTIIVDRTKRRTGPTIEAVGVLGNLVSQHYDLIIVDDAVNLDDVNSPTIRKKKLIWFLSLFDVLEPDGQMILIGTRWDIDDLYNEVIKLSTAAEKVLDEVKDEKLKSKILKYKFKIKIDKAIKPDGTPFYPERFSKEHLQFLKDTKGEFFNAQYMNDPSGVKGRPFNENRIFEYIDGQLPTNLRKIQAVDLASRETLKSDFFAHVTLGFDDFNNIWLVDYYLDRIQGPVQLEMIKIKTALFHPEKEFIESNAYQLVLYQFLMADTMGKLLSGIIEPITTIKNKDLRIRGLATVFEYNKFLIHKVKHQELKKMLIAYPSVEHDDLLDALEIAITKGQQYLFEERSKEPSIRGM